MDSIKTRILHFFKCAFCFIVLVFIIIPLIAVAITPFLIVRAAHQLVILLFSKSPSKMVHPIGQIFAHDFFLEKPRFNIVFCAVLDGHLTVQKLTTVVENTLVSKLQRRQTSSNSNSSAEPAPSSAKLLYPELQQKCVKLGGYFYWVNNPNFKVCEHVREWENSNSKDLEVSEGKLKEIVSELITRKWDSNRSPWEIILVHNYTTTAATGTGTGTGNSAAGGPKTVFIIRTHHFMMDGHSLFNAILSMLTGKLDYNVKMRERSNSKERGRAKFFKFCNIFPLIFQLPLDLARTYCCHPKGKDENSWRISSGAQIENPANKCFTNWSRGVPIQDIKAIKNAFGVSFQAVLCSVMAKAVQNLMRLEQGVSKSQKGIPEEISAVVPIPMPGHPDRLENYYAFTFTSLPIGEENPEKRLQRGFNELKKSAKPLHLKISYQLYNLCGKFPTVFTRQFLKADMGYTVNFATFPGINGPAYLGGVQLISSLNTVGLCAGKAGATLSALSSFGHIKFAINISAQVFPSQEDLDFDDFIQSEMKALLQIVAAKKGRNQNRNENIMDVLAANSDQNLMNKSQSTILTIE